MRQRLPPPYYPHLPTHTHTRHPIPVLWTFMCCCWRRQEGKLDGQPSRRHHHHPLSREPGCGALPGAGDILRHGTRACSLWSFLIGPFLYAAGDAHLCLPTTRPQRQHCAPHYTIAPALGRSLAPSAALNSCGTYPHLSLSVANRWTDVSWHAAKAVAGLPPWYLPACLLWAPQLSS